MKNRTMLLSQQKITPKLSDLLTIFSSKKHNYKEVMRRYFPNKHLHWTGSGREALRQILLNLNYKRVGVPAFTCHVVSDAVKRADKDIIYYDSGIISDVKDIKKIINKIDILIVSYNFGFVPEIDKIAKLCKEKNIILIEDCAQALGARYKGKLAGIFGDYAFYSFGISKNIGFCGGIIGSNKEIKVKKGKNYPKTKLIKVLIEILIAPIFFNKYIYPISRKLLSNELNKKQEYLAYTCPKIAQKVIIQQLIRYGKILKTRQENAKLFLNTLKHSKINFIRKIDNSNPSWLYFCISTNNREMLKYKLLKEGVELGNMKTFRCLDNNCKKALQAERENLTLALYRPEKEIKFITKKIRKVNL